MAYYGIPQPAHALSFKWERHGLFLAWRNLITAQSVYGADGNDVISIGAVGRNASASVSFSSDRS